MADSNVALDASPNHVVTGNFFLDSLPETIVEAVRPLLKEQMLKHGDVIFERDEPLAQVLFPIGGIISLVMEMMDGEVAEVGIIGCEGMSGSPIVLGQASSNQRAIVQLPGNAQALPIFEFRALLDGTPEFKAHALRYVQATLMIATQVSACNNLHVTNERCARWLLMAHDRVDGDVVPLTQEFLGQMLGVRRASVTLAALALQEAGFISYSRGSITIRNRAGLESVACECYASLERDWKNLMGYSVRKLSGSRSG